MFGLFENKGSSDQKDQSNHMYWYLLGTVADFVTPVEVQIRPRELVFSDYLFEVAQK